ncbi:MAG: 3'-5' exonuclease [Alloprevotella sp.]|nr:3'-5' exonuclease [Alloprevotella sp.]
MDFLKNLNEAQLDAVVYHDGPELVVAGAGAGKTRVLTTKIAQLIQNGIFPSHILVLTFTNKAAREMNERIAKMCGEDFTRGLWSGTFHSIFARILRIEHEATGYPADFTIYDTSDVRSLLKHIVKDLELDDKTYKPAVLASRISWAKGKCITAEMYANDESIQRRDANKDIPKTAEIYAIYERRLQQANAMDFDDLLLQTYFLFLRHPEIAERYRERFTDILVDEFQDTNYLQNAILSQLTSPDSHICVVGDDAQSIYGFRGAEISNILEFTQRYPKTRTFKLECNYRSTSHIVEAANSVIAHNNRQIPKKVYAAGEKGEPLHVFAGMNDREEARLTVGHIRSLMRRGVAAGEIAVLYRTNAQSRSFEEALQTVGVPYQVYGGQSFYQRKEIKDILAYLRLVSNPHDDESFLRIVNYPTRGIGNTTLTRLREAALQAQKSLWQVIAAPEEVGFKPGGRAMTALKGFHDMMTGFQNEAQKTDVLGLTRFILERAGIATDLAADSTPEGISRRENMDEFLASIASEAQEREQAHSQNLSLQDFLASVSLLSDKSDNETDTREKVSLMTIHAAKGLEFDAVFVTGLEDELFPNATAKINPNEMEEERRLFYVAITRARRHCFLSYAQSRFRYGVTEATNESPFLHEIDSTHLTYATDSFSTAGGRHTSNTRGYEPTTRGYTSAAKGYEPTTRGYASAAKGYEPTTRRNNVFSASGDSSSSYSSQTRNATPYSSQTRNATPYSTQTRNANPYSSQTRNANPYSTSRLRRVSSLTPATTSAAASSPTSGITPGRRIHHERFGDGTIIAVENTMQSEKVRVQFDTPGVGEKKLLVKFARFTFID